jgi:tetratricopeptide (TPR) repeat protein
MKTTLVYLVCSVFLMNWSSASNCMIEKSPLPKNRLQEHSLKCIHQNDTLLINIQQRIINAFVEDKMSQNDTDMVQLELALLNLNRKSNNSLVIYWYSYACFYHSILLMIEKDNHNSEKILEEGIKRLEETDTQSSEHLALLALMESFSMQFASGNEMPFISQHVKQNAEGALQLDSLNLRAYYVMASNDFYTPEQYGGGKKAEGYLKKAINLKDQSVSNPYLPSWGKNSAYEMLIRLYIHRKQFAEAKKYYEEAKSLFPDDYMINSFASELINY